ncbi:MAG: DUF547 domain-containing protein [Vampirovibrionales bacterium]|nr:DUF547 domain-containing protein [Vampirovibrionales bacterium]
MNASRFSLCRFLTALGMMLVLGALSACLSVYAARVINDASTSRPFVATSWQGALSQFVNEAGQVDFIRLKAQPRRLLQFLEQLNAVSPDTHPTYFETPQDRLAYWINAYNAVALALIQEYYPIENVSEVPKLMEDKRYRIGGVPTSLMMIQEKIEKRFATQAALMPKALFALSLYSKDSPPLQAQAYQGPILKQQLDTQMNRFLGSPKNLRVMQGEYGLNPANTCAVLRLSPWFAQVRYGIEKSYNSRPDFTTKVSTAKAFFETVKPYLSPDDHAKMLVRCPHGIGYFPPNGALRQLPQEEAPKSDSPD